MCSLLPHNIGIYHYAFIFVCSFKIIIILKKSLMVDLASLMCSFKRDNIEGLTDVCVYACFVYDCVGTGFVDCLEKVFIHDDLVPKGVHENRTKGVENKVDDTLKLVVFLECLQC